MYVIPACVIRCVDMLAAGPMRWPPSDDAQRLNSNHPLPSWSRENPVTARPRAKASANLRLVGLLQRHRLRRALRGFLPLHHLVRQLDAHLHLAARRTSARNRLGHPLAVQPPFGMQPVRRTATLNPSRGYTIKIGRIAVGNRPQLLDIEECSS